MDRKDLINKIVGFCFYLEIIKNIDNEIEIKKVIDEHLDEIAFIEDLIRTMITKARVIKGLDIDGLKEVLTELEVIRVELELKELFKSS